MTDESEQKTYFEVYYHPNEYTRLFMFAFETLEQAESVIEKSKPNFKRVEKVAVKHPYIAINTNKHSEREMLEIFYAEIEN